MEMTRDCFSSAEGFDYNFPRILAPGKTASETEERNTSPLNQIRVLDWRSIQSQGLGLIFVPLFSFPLSSAGWRRCGPSDFCPCPVPLVPNLSHLDDQTPLQKNLSCASGASCFPSSEESAFLALLAADPWGRPGRPPGAQTEAV